LGFSRISSYFSCCWQTVDNNANAPPTTTAAATTTTTTAKETRSWPESKSYLAMLIAGQYQFLCVYPSDSRFARYFLRVEIAEPLSLAPSKNSNNKNRRKIRDLFETCLPDTKIHIDTRDTDTIYI